LTWVVREQRQDVDSQVILNYRLATQDFQSNPWHKYCLNRDRDQHSLAITQRLLSADFLEGSRIVTPTAEIARTENALPVNPGSGSTEVDLPVTVIERRSGWQLVDLAELWRFRELLFFLVWRDVKVRYRQTVIGVAWALLQPLATMAAFSLFLGRVASSPEATVAYPLFVFSGLLPWGFFSGAVSSAGGSVVASERLITKVYFPRLMIPFGTVAAGLLDFVIAFGVLVFLMPWFGAWPGVSFLVLPLVVGVLLALGLGMGVFLAALTVAYRDFKVVVPLVMQLWMFATPAIFMQNPAVFGPRMKGLLLLNPMHGAIVNFRAAVLGGPFDWPALGASTLAALVVLVGGCFYFRRVERGFADII
jgi:lipopolysaccharide transport system permease protein